MIACHESENGGNDPENEGLNLKYAIDWSALATKPTGLTMLFYPTNGGETLKYHFDAVDLVNVSLPEQDYSLICFNQSVEEFENFRFDLDDFETASVTALSAESLTAGTLAITSQKSVQGTRGVNLRIVILPTNIVKSMSVSIPVPDVPNDVRVSAGSLTNLSAGFNISERKPLKETMELPLPSDVWSVSTLDDAETTTVLTANFATFGVSLANDTRAAFDDAENRNLLTVSVMLADGTTKEITADVTESIVEQYLAALEEEANAASKVSSATGYINKVGYVDLGLLADDGSPLYWGISNVGGYLPEDYGNYYSWGEIFAYGQEVFLSPVNTGKVVVEEGVKEVVSEIEANDLYVKTIYDWAHYAYCEGTETSLTKYCSDADYGTVDDLVQLETSDDAATSYNYSPWRIPTSAEYEKLVNECVWEWTTLNGVPGSKIYGPNGNSIFLPAVGSYRNEKLTGARQAGYYWSSSLYTKMPSQAYGLAISSETEPLVLSLPRYIGSPIRAVSSEALTILVPDDNPNTH